MQKVLIIAEAGVNHNGNIRLAKEMVHAAYDAGADIIKFQTFKAEKVISQFAPKADYQLITTGKDESQLEMARKFEMSFKDFRELFDYCNEVGIIFLSTAADNESLYFLMELGQKYIKIPSATNLNFPVLDFLCKNYSGDIHLSTGMTSEKEIDEIFLFQSSHGDYQSSYYCLSMLLNESLVKKRFEIVDYLKGHGVGTSVYYPHPVPHLTYYKEKYGYGEETYPVAAMISNGSIALPVGPHLNIEDMDYIIASISKAIKEVK